MVVPSTADSVRSRPAVTRTGLFATSATVNRYDCGWAVAVTWAPAPRTAAPPLAVAFPWLIAWPDDRIETSRPAVSVVPPSSRARA